MMKKRFKWFAQTLAAVLLCATTSSGQITITSNDIPNTIGIRHTLRVSPGYVPVNLGSSGTNQEWDLTNIPAPGEITVGIVDRDETPDPSAFPTANLIVKWEGEAGEVVCGYANLTSMSLMLIGGIVAGADSILSLTLINWPPLLSFPVRYGDDWTTLVLGEITVGGIPMIFVDSAGVEIDGWGTVITDDMGSSPCLRLKSRHHFIVTLVGVPMFDFSIWAYLWMAPGFPDYAAIVSELNAEEDFTSGFFVHLGSVSDAEEPVEILPITFQLESPYPNPFNPQTTIPYTISHLSDVELTIYNALGQRVRTLVQAQTLPGSYSVIWDGTDDFGNRVGTGAYYCRLLNSPGNAFSKKLLLVR